MSNIKYWFGSIPETWTVKKINELFIQRTTKVSDKEYKPLSVTKNGVMPQLTNAAKTDNGNNRKLVCKNDFVINSRSDRKSSCGVSELYGSVSLIYIILYLINDATFNIKLIHYLFRSHYFSEEFYRNGKGIVADLWTTNYMDMKNIYIPIPPREEQDKIVAYLDYQISNINKLMLSKRKQITLLEEYKKTKISEVVTKGLNPNVEMKDSGIDWIGQIPKHWDIKKLKEILSIHGRIGYRGYSENDLVDENSGAISLSPSNIKDEKINYDKCTYISFDKYFESPEIMVKHGDMIFVKTGSSYGKSCIVSEILKETTINPQLVLFTNIKINTKYLFYISLSFIIKNQIENNVIGGTIPTLSQTKISNFYTIIPSINEIDEIAAYLDNLTFKLDNLISKHKLYIEKLEEYKKTLISDVVTGKIDVRDIVIPEYEKVDIVENNNEDTDNLAME